MTHIKRCSLEDLPQWVVLRFALWPDEDQTMMAAEAPAILAHPDRLVLVAHQTGDVAGFVEASIRRNYVNGCESSPVGFVEGLYVRPEHRGHGIARALISEVENWARDHKLKELASDALLENDDSHAMHKALGFSQTERVVYFRKKLM